MLARLTQLEFVPAARRFSQLQSLAAWFGEASYNTADGWSGKAQPSFQASPTFRTNCATWRTAHTTPYAHAAAGKNDAHPDPPVPAEHQDDAVNQTVAPASAGKTPITKRQQNVHCFCLPAVCNHVDHTCLEPKIVALHRTEVTVHCTRTPRRWQW